MNKPDKSKEKITAKIASMQKDIRDTEARADSIQRKIDAHLLGAKHSCRASLQ
jgi:uncharacterized protein Yka (UPF0111/DUF47 family)